MFNKETNSKTTLFGVKPSKITKDGVFYDELKVIKENAKKYSEKELELLGKEDINENMRKVAKIFDDGVDIYRHASNRLGKAREELAESAKKSSEGVRQATEKLAQGLLRIEKQANFSKLENYCLLIERTATAMNSLAELEKSGKLEKIINALK